MHLSYKRLSAAHTYRQQPWGKYGGEILGKECVVSENHTADVTFCPLHYRKEVNADEKLLYNSYKILQDNFDQ